MFAMFEVAEVEVEERRRAVAARSTRAVGRVARLMRENIDSGEGESWLKCCVLENEKKVELRDEVFLYRF
jgi:hypothetical protein